MTATRREAIELLERVPEDKLTYVVQILSGIDVMPTTERGKNADEYIREMRDNDRL